MIEEMIQKLFFSYSVVIYVFVSLDYMVTDFRLHVQITEVLQRMSPYAVHQSWICNSDGDDNRV